VGCGGRGTGAAVQALSSGQDVQLVAMADAFEDRLTPSLETLLSSEREDWEGGGVDLSARIDVPAERRSVGFEAYRQVLAVVVGLQRHYQRVYREWVQRLHAGMIGDLVLGRVYWNSAGVWVRPREPGQTEMEYQMRNWYYFNWLCGDHIVEQHIHNIDVANWIKGSYPVSIQGTGSRAWRTGKDYGEIGRAH